MAKPILRVADFDCTLTVYHTFKYKWFYKPENNSKTGLDSIVRHNENEIFAIATHHNDTNYVLSYLLPLLKLSTADLLLQETINYPTHKLSKLFFKNQKYPILISTTDKPEHRKQGKNQALLDIAKELPACDEYYFYDDDQKNVTEACALDQYFVHLVTRESAFKIDHLKTLISYLTYYKSNREQNTMQYSTWGSFFTLNFMGYSKKQKLEAVDELIDAIHHKRQVDEQHLGALRQGTLGTLIQKWQSKSSLKLNDVLVSTNQQLTTT